MEEALKQEGEVQAHQVQVQVPQVEVPEGQVPEGSCDMWGGEDVVDGPQAVVEAITLSAATEDTLPMTYDYNQCLYDVAVKSDALDNAAL